MKPLTSTEPNILRGPARIQNKWRPNINVGLFCSGAQPYHRTVPDGGIRSGMGRTAQSLIGSFVYLALVGDVPMIRTRDLNPNSADGTRRATKKTLVLSSNPGEATLLCEAPDWHRTKYTPRPYPNTKQMTSQHSLLLLILVHKT